MREPGKSGIGLTFAVMSLTAMLEATVPPSVRLTITLPDLDWSWIPTSPVLRACKHCSCYLKPTIKLVEEKRHTCC